jgi:hypothetical protein
LRSLRSFDANYKEYVAYKKIERYYSDDVWNIVARCYGFVQTNLGTGLCVELICDDDGRISKTLKQYIWECGQTEDVEVALGVFEFWALALGLPSRLLESSNILVQAGGCGIRRLALIDGLGWPQIIPYRYLMRSAARRAAGKKLEGLRRHVAGVIAAKAAGREFGKGWIDESRRDVTASRLEVGTPPTAIPSVAP